MNPGYHLDRLYPHRPPSVHGPGQAPESHGRSAPRGGTIRQADATYRPARPGPAASASSPGASNPVSSEARASGVRVG